MTHESLLESVWGSAHKRDFDYLRAAIPALRRKMESDPANPGLIINEPGVGYQGGRMTFAATSRNISGAHPPFPSILSRPRPMVIQILGCDLLLPERSAYGEHIIQLGNEGGLHTGRQCGRQVKGGQESRNHPNPEKAHRSSPVHKQPCVYLLSSLTSHRMFGISELGAAAKDGEAATAVPAAAYLIAARLVMPDRISCRVILYNLAMCSPQIIWPRYRRRLAERGPRPRIDIKF